MAHDKLPLPPARTGHLVVLCADDYAMTGGVSRAIEELAEAGRISATSAIVTLPPWPEHARRIARLRGAVATGLHLNLTLERPLGPMPGLAPDGRLLPAHTLISRAVRGDLDAHEVEAEIRRQIARFEEHAGHPPDFIDGHQHVHSLPIVRDALIRAIQAGFTGTRPLVRDPGDGLVPILRRGGAVTKALTVAWLARGFGGAARRANIPTNDSFAGMTRFGAQAAVEFERALTAAGRLHLVMCHPGFPDKDLAALDPVTDRRRVEFDVLMGDNALYARLWHPRRAADGPPIDWQREVAENA